MLIVHHQEETKVALSSGSLASILRFPAPLDDLQYCMLAKSDEPKGGGGGCYFCSRHHLVSTHKWASYGRQCVVVLAKCAWMTQRLKLASKWFPSFPRWGKSTVQRVMLYYRTSSALRCRLITRVGCRLRHGTAQRVGWVALGAPVRRTRALL